MMNRREASAVFAGAAVPLAALSARGGEPDDSKIDVTREEGDVKREFIRLERGWAKAVLDRDRDACRRYLSDDFSVVDSTGHVWRRESYLDGIASGVGGVESLHIDELEVRIFHDAAVVTARLVYRCGPGRSDLNGAHRFTKTYFKRDGQWRCVAAQEGRIVA
jgi:ketosteroid isomerase-like protein